MSENQTKDEVLELVRLIDRNKSNLFKKLDIFRGELAFPFATFVGLFARASEMLYKEKSVKIHRGEKTWLCQLMKF